MFQSPFAEMGSQGLFLVSSTVILLIIIFFMYKTYRASMNVEARLAEFSSLTQNAFGRKLRLIEVNADEYKLNKGVLGPLARIIDEYCVLTTDAQGVITFANDRFLSLSGFNIGDLVGKHESIHHPDGERDDSGFLMRCDQAGNGVWNGEICNRGKDGQRYWVNMFIFPLSYITDEDEGYIYFGTDITRIKSQNSALMQAVRDKDEKLNQVESLLLHSEKMASLGTVSAGIAHEINNPMAFLAANLRRCEQYLAGLAAVVQGLRQRIKPDRFNQFLDSERPLDLTRDQLDLILRDYPELMQETHEGVERIRKIVNDLKHFSYNKQEDFAPVDIARCLDTALNLVRHETRRCTLTRELSPSVPALSGSESQLSQVFMNLLTNAAQALEQQNTGEIRLYGEQDGESYCIGVRDNGPGIEADQLTQIFEPFFTTKPMGKGTGLGLSIAQDIIQRHGGTLTARSTPGDGTCFEVRLPLAGSRHDTAA